MAPWTPAFATGIATWLDAAAMRFADGYAIDDPEEMLPDRSGRGKDWHFVEGGIISFQTNELGGLPVFRYADHLINELTSTDIAIASGPLSVAMAVDNMLDDRDIWSDASQQYMAYSDGGDLGMYAGSAVTPLALSVGDPHVIVTIFDDDASLASVDGTASNAVDPGGNTPVVDEINPYLITVNNGAFMGEEFVGDLGEIVVADHAWTTAERQLIEGYLGHKWGIALASGHPYEIAPPRVRGRAALEGRLSGGFKQGELA